MKAFMIGRSKTINKVNYKKCIDLFSNIVNKNTGKILASDDNFKVLEVTDEFHRFQIIESSLLENEKKCWSSKEYHNDLLFRKNGSDLVDLIFFKSGDFTK